MVSELNEIVGQKIEELLGVENPHMVSEVVWVRPEFHPWFCHLFLQRRFDINRYHDVVNTVWVLTPPSGTGWAVSTIYNNDGDDSCHLHSITKDNTCTEYTWSSRTVHCRHTISTHSPEDHRKGIPALHLKRQASLSSCRWALWCSSLLRILRGTAIMSHILMWWLVSIRALILVFNTVLSEQG